MKYITTGIDIGSQNARLCVISHDSKTNQQENLLCLKIILGGIHRGHVYKKEEVKKGVEKLIKEAEKIIASKIETATLSFGGTSLAALTVSASTVATKANNEITFFDIENLEKTAEESAQLANYRVIHNNSLEYKVDGKLVIGNIEGLSGIKIENKKLFIRALDQHIDEIEEVFVEIGVDINHITPKGVTSSEIGLTDKQKMVGVGYLDIGADTTTLIVYENGIIIGYVMIPIGSNDITNDIALGLKVSLEEAELVKTGNSIHVYPRKKIDDIIQARIDDISELVNNYLKKIKRQELLPAGIYITGGGSELSQIEQSLKQSLKLPIKKISFEIQTTHKGVIRNPEFLEAYSLAYLSDSFEENGSVNKNFSLIEKIKKNTQSFFKQFLP